MTNGFIIKTVFEEQSQDHKTRAGLYTAIEGLIKRPIISYFTSFHYPVGIENTDADILESFLNGMDLSSGLALLISSPGGDGLAAERIIRICRSYSGTGEYWAIVPGKAKSAATMICLGASKICMGPTSELGPVDPQIPNPDPGALVKWLSAYNVFNSYDDLFQRAINAEGRIEPYIQQLSNYNPMHISELRSAYELSKDIVIRALGTGMLRELTNEEIENKIGIFINPERTIIHGRAISSEDAQECDLNIDEVDVSSEFWKKGYELYARTSNYVTSFVSKCIENASDSLGTRPPSDA